jgi:hypothetical protein
MKFLSIAAGRLTFAVAVLVCVPIWAFMAIVSPVRLARVIRATLAELDASFAHRPEVHNGE